jgi:hypothetical protein
MIEHVDHKTQKSAVANIARLLKPDGVLVISTPNPEVTQLYGENPYHLREMTETQFLELLHEHFSYVTIVKQKVRVSVTFEHDQPSSGGLIENPKYQKVDCVEPIAFIAVCSTDKPREVAPTISFDEETDLILDYMSRQNSANQERLSWYNALERTKKLENEKSNLELLLAPLNHELSSYKTQATEFSNQVRNLQTLLAETQKSFSDQATEYVRQATTLQTQSAEQQATLSALRGLIQQSGSGLVGKLTRLLNRRFAKISTTHL